MSAKTRKCRQCPAMIYADNVSGLCRSCYVKEQAASQPSALVAADRERERLRFVAENADKKYKSALKTIGEKDREIAAFADMDAGLETYDIEPRMGAGTSEGTVVVKASDWHSEKRIRSGTVSGLNEFTLEICKARVDRLFRGAIRLTRLLQQDITINSMVLALLGDFIDNEIHEADSAEQAQLTPMEAIVFAESGIASGIDALLNHTELNLVIPCHSGNHARVTRKVRIANENGHSLEYLMYRHLEARYASEKRVQFVIPDGYHSFINVYDRPIRFHHGHHIKYQGGIGGIFIPAFKKVSQWDKARPAAMDCFGHFHQTKDGGKFRTNGSLCGYDPYAVSIGADYEPPYQSLFLVDKKRGFTCNWPILLDEPKA